MVFININVGILGHVDSGKTSLAKALSTIASTSAFDKNPQSKKRGITLDLGFSSFTVDRCVSQESCLCQKYSNVQFTLVDCPGHSSLIRTILCGSQIIDIMLLVIDCTKGFQTQTAECLVIGSITCDQMIVVLNKCDMLDPSIREGRIEKMKKRIWKTLEDTKFRNAPIAEVAAAAGGVQREFTADVSNTDASDIEALIQLLVQTCSDPSAKRSLVSKHNFLFAVDHCFCVTGQGTVMTGTVLAGTASVGEVIEIPYQRMQKKIKSIQMFRQPVNSIGPGDRAGICVAQLDPTLLERGLIGNPSGGNLVPCHACILSDVHKIDHFKSAVNSKARFHMFVGQETALARLTFFRSTRNPVDQDVKSDVQLQLDNDDQQYEYIEELPCENDVRNGCRIWVLLEFDRPFICPNQSLVIGARLDMPSTTTSCRLAFYGRVDLQLSDPNYRTAILPRLYIYKLKSRRGQVERIIDSRTCIVRGLFKRETNWNIFVGLQAHLVRTECELGSTGLQDDSPVNPKLSGRIESSFGQSGKCRMILDDYLPDELVQQYSTKPSKNPSRRNVELDNSTVGVDRPKLDVILEFKRHTFDIKRRIMQ